MTTIFVIDKRFLHPLAGVDCGTCQTPMVLTKDAIGRQRSRCPRCTGVGPRPRLHHGELRQVQAVLVSRDYLQRTAAESRPNQGPAARAPLGSYRDAKCENCGALTFRGTGRPRRLCDACATPEYLAELEAKARRNAIYRETRTGPYAPTDPPGIRRLP